MEWGGLKTCGNNKAVKVGESPDCRNDMFKNGRYQTRPGMAKSFTTALTSDIMYMCNPKSGFCKENYKLVITRDGRIITSSIIAKEWTSQTDWDTGTKSQVDTAASAGDVLLAKDWLSVYTLANLPQSANVQGYWKFEEASGTLFDETANNHDGTLNAGSNTKILLHLNGTDGATSTIDSSVEAHTITFVANAQLDTAAKKFGTASLLLDGVGDYLYAPDSVDWNFGTGDFTIDFWFRTTDNTKYQGIITQGVNGVTTIDFSYTNTDKLSMSFVSATVGVGYYVTTNVVNIANNTWYHIAFVRSGSTAYMFVDGVSQAVTENTAFGTLPDCTGNLGIGCYIPTVGNFVYGQVDELRISKAIAQWTANFTPETSEYGSSPDTGLFQQSGKVDYGIGFDGLDDYVDVGDVDILNDMTISVWVKPENLNTASIVAKFDDYEGGAGQGSSYLLRMNDSGKIRMTIADSNEDAGNNYEQTDAVVLTANVWNHVVGVYDSSGQIVALYHNGAVKPSTTAGTIPNSIPDTPTPTTIGKMVWRGESAEFFTGIIDEVIIWDKTLTADEVALLYNGYYYSNGYDRLQYDSGIDNTDWSTYAFAADETPSGTNIKIRCKSASSQAGLASASWGSWLDDTSGNLDCADNRWIEVEAYLETTDTSNTPTLNSLAVNGMTPIGQ